MTFRRSLTTSDRRNPPDLETRRTGEDGPQDGAGQLPQVLETNPGQRFFDIREWGGGGKLTVPLRGVQTDP